MKNYLCGDRHLLALFNNPGHIHKHGPQRQTLDKKYTDE